MTRIVPAPSSEASQGQGPIEPELETALRAQGPHGQRALNLLRDADKVLSDPGQFAAPYEVAQSCLRGAVDSILMIAGMKFPGLQSARTAVVDQATALINASGDGAEVDLAELAQAVQDLRAEEGNRGGFRVRQVAHLVREQTGREMGGPERQAALDSWNSFYDHASAVLHGSNGGESATVDMFRGVLAATSHLFLSLPERAQHLHELAVAERPTVELAREVAMMTDPRAGAYFFRAAASDQWLELLEEVQPERLLPDGQGWPAEPYLKRMLRSDPARILRWVVAHLEAIAARGPGALGMAVGLLRDAGAQACPLLRKITKAEPGFHVLRYISYLLGDIPLAERTAQWLLAVEEVLRAPLFTQEESWQTAVLLRAVVQTVHPGGRPRPDGDRLGGTCRFALSGILAHALADDYGQWEMQLHHDLREVSLQQDPPRSFTLAAARAVLDLGLADATLGVPLDRRMQPLTGKLPSGPVLDRLLAVHLLESHAADCSPGLPISDRLTRAEAWWQQAIPLAGRLVHHGSPRADVADLLHLQVTTCPAARLEELLAALTAGLGPAPQREEVTAWERAYTDHGKPLPPRWSAVRTLSPVLPAEILDPWRPLLTALEGIAGPVPDRPKPAWEDYVVPHGGLKSEAFAAIATADGPAAAIAALATATPPVDEQDVAQSAKAQVLADLVSADPKPWAAVPGAVLAAAVPALQAAYLAALHQAYSKSTLDPGDSLADVTAAAFAARTTPASDQDAAVDRLHQSIGKLFHLGLDYGLDLDDQAVAWLNSLITAWTRPRRTSGYPLLAATDTAGGTALLTLIAWGLRRAYDTEGMIPPVVTDALHILLEAEPDDQALAVIGRCLAQLTRCAPAWTAEHTERLHPLAEPWRPARIWLLYGDPDNRVMADLACPELLAVLCGPDAEPAMDKAWIALLDPADPLGMPKDFLVALATRDGGSQAVSTLLSRLAFAVTRFGDDQPRIQRAADLWQTALDADLPCEALAGLGRFAYTPQLPDPLWLELTARTMERQPNLDALEKITARAAQHPDSPQALQIMAAALTVPQERFYADEIQRQAGNLFATTTLKMSEEFETLRTALVNAGMVEAAIE